MLCNGTLSALWFLVAGVNPWQIWMCLESVSLRIVFFKYVTSSDYVDDCKKVKFSRHRPGVAQRLGRGIAPLFHDRGTRSGWVISSTPRPHFTPGKDPVPVLQEAGWAPGPVWTGGNSRPHLDSITDRPARSQSLYRLSYRAHVLDCRLLNNGDEFTIFCENWRFKFCTSLLFFFVLTQQYQLSMCWQFDNVHVSCGNRQNRNKSFERDWLCCLLWNLSSIYSCL